MKEKLTLAFFIDALGWEVLKRHSSFLFTFLPYRKKLKTILGYSSACDPSIISGKKPSQHGLWSSFYYSPTSAPYRWTRFLSWLPAALTNRSRVRTLLSRLIKKVHGFTGYFQIYHLPFCYLPLFDYAEKQRIWEEGGMKGCLTLFDLCSQKSIPYYIGDLAGSDERQLSMVKALIQKESIAFAYLLLGKLDALMHTVGTCDKKVDQLLLWYDQEISLLIKEAYLHYEKVDLYLFSDHGMHDIGGSVDIQAKMSTLPLRYGKDYVAFYDSTMARFWFLTPHAKEAIVTCLKSMPEGRILSCDELKTLGVYFPSYQYGETIFLVNPGLLILPSFMGLKLIKGMHGYHPDDPHSYAVLCSNNPLSHDLQSIEEIYSLLATHLT